MTVASESLKTSTYKNKNRFHYSILFIKNKKLIAVTTAITVVAGTILNTIPASSNNKEVEETKSEYVVMARNDIGYDKVEDNYNIVDDSESLENNKKFDGALFLAPSKKNLKINNLKDYLKNADESINRYSEEEWDQKSTQGLV